MASLHLTNSREADIDFFHVTASLKMSMDKSRSRQSSNNHSNDSSGYETPNTESSDHDDRYPSPYAGRISPSRLVIQPEEENDCRSKLLRLHQQTTLISTPTYGPARKLPEPDLAGFEVKLTITHYHLGDLIITGYGSKVALAKECAARGMIGVLVLGEADLNAAPANLEPAPFFLSTAIQKGRIVRQGHLTRLQEIATHWDKDDQALFLDIEVYDGVASHATCGSRSTIVLEVGIATVTVQQLLAPGQLEWNELQHLIVEENVDLRNKHCPDRRFDLESRLGVSRIMSQVDVTECCRLTVGRLNERRGSRGRIYLVGHSIEGDRRWMEGCLGVDLNGLTDIDIADVYAAYEGRDTRRKLEWLCHNFGVAASLTHNAGNDVAYTMELCQKMAQGL